jgi:DNA-binding NarL/FixJ family response regulator
VTRVLVVARSPVVRAGLESLLARSGAFSVLGSAAADDFASTIADTIADAAPDVVLLALEAAAEPPLPLLLGPDALARAPAVVVLGEDPLESWAPRALRLGARAVLPRDADAEEIVAAIEAAAAGLVALPPELVAAVPARGPVRGPAVTAPAQPLTPREVEVLGLLAAGYGNKTIAARLGISEHTVKSHLGSLYAKLGVSSRAEAVASGVRLGVLML